MTNLKRRRDSGDTNKEGEKNFAPPPKSTLTSTTHPATT